jgi:hypothetical protein
MTSMGKPKAGPSFVHDEVPWLDPLRFHEHRVGWKWHCVETAEDGVTRPVGPAFRFWRRLNAMRASQALTIAFINGHHADSECTQRNLIV